MKSLLVGLSALALVAATGIPLTIGNVVAQSTRPYAGLLTRPIKALSAEQIADLKAGRGMITRADAALCPIARLCGGGFRHLAQAEPLNDQQETLLRQSILKLAASVEYVGRTRITTT